MRTIKLVNTTGGVSVSYQVERDYDFSDQTINRIEVSDPKDGTKTFVHLNQWARFEVFEGTRRSSGLLRTSPHESQVTQFTTTISGKLSPEQEQRLADENEVRTLMEKKNSQPSQEFDDELKAKGITISALPVKKKA